MNYTIPTKKMLIINILDILKNYSDEDHRLSVKGIVEILEKDYSQKVDRKAVKSNLENLIDFGYELEWSESTRKKSNGEDEVVKSNWYLLREFTDAELRMLIDNMLFSKTLPYNQCKEIIGKLEGLSNKYFNSKVKHIRNMPENLPENKEVFFTIDILDEAITKGKQVSFHYISHDVDKKAYPRKKDDVVLEYIVSPYQMAATNGRYYLICNRTGYPKVSNYRIDRIKNIKLLDDKITPLKKLKGYEKGLDLPKHMAEHIYMFAGESVRVIFHSTKAMVSDIMDWFGRDIRITPLDDYNIKVEVKVNERAMFFWALQYGLYVEVKEPKSLRKELVEASKKLIDKYND